MSTGVGLRWQEHSLEYAGSKLMGVEMYWCIAITYVKLLCRFPTGVQTRTFYGNLISTYTGKSATSVTHKAARW
jgi:hypothetical protein